jgi:L-cysteine:1D-myo-inositol 2-amino-2-deoxy-alpha-D-glucopyranoside ligase
VLSTGALGHPIDIHGGGDDLIYPHHESEIAQAEAAGVAPYVRHWTHVAMVNHQGEKMSKSLGNLVFVRDLVGRVPGAAVRLLLGAHHYRESWTFDDDEVDAAAARLERYVASMRSGGTLRPDAASDHERRFFARLDDDLDTPGGLVELDALAQDIIESPSNQEPGVHGATLLARLLGILGVEADTGAA